MSNNDEKKFIEEVDKAQAEFRKVVGASYILLSSNPEYTQERIVMGLMYTLLQTIESIQDETPITDSIKRCEDLK